jgi:hypothetical protein
MPRSGGIGCAVHGHVYAHLVPALYGDPTSLWADNYIHIYIYVVSCFEGRIHDKIMHYILLLYNIPFGLEKPDIIIVNNYCIN